MGTKEKIPKNHSDDSDCMVLGSKLTGTYVILSSLEVKKVQSTLQETWAYVLAKPLP